MIFALKQKYSELKSEVNDFFGLSFKGAVRALFITSLFWIVGNFVFLTTLFILFNIKSEDHREILDVLLLMLASPILFVEMFGWVVGIKERRFPVSLFLTVNFFFLFSAFEILILKPLRFIKYKPDEDLEMDNHYYWNSSPEQYSQVFTQYHIELETTKKAVSLKNVNLWAEISSMDKFTENYFQKSQSLTRFFKERIHKPGENQLDWDFFLFSLMIPHRKTISVEGLKHILLAYPGIHTNLWWEQIPITALNTNLLTEAFQSYDEKAMKKLLCRRYDSQDFLETIDLLSKSPQTLPLFENFKEIKTFLKNQSFSGLHHPQIKPVHGLKKGPYQFFILSKEEDYKLWATKLDNCIERTYWLLDDVDIIGITKNNNFYAALSFRNGKFEQIKKIRNGDVDRVEGQFILDIVTLEIKKDIPEKD